MSNGTRNRLSKMAVIAALAYAAGVAPLARAQDDLADVTDKSYRAANNAKFIYYEIAADPLAAPPAEGYKLLLVLPGGDGGRDFLPFVKRIYKFALTPDYLVVQLVAPKWAKSEEIVWPTAKDGPAAAKIAADKFVAAVVKDMSKRHPIDARHIFALGWSSGGPAVYAASLAENSPLTGCLPAMSIFFPKRLPPLVGAKGRAYYILHSPEDDVCRIELAREAQEKLSAVGAQVEFAEYPGGHGWQGDVFGNIRTGIEWMQSQTTQRDERGD